MTDLSRNVKGVKDVKGLGEKVFHARVRARKSCFTPHTLHTLHRMNEINYLARKLGVFTPFTPFTE